MVLRGDPPMRAGWGSPWMLPSPMHPLHPRPHPAAPPGGAPSDGAPMEPPSPIPAPPLWSKGGVVGEDTPFCGWTRPFPVPPPSSDRERLSPQNRGGSRYPGEPPKFGEGPGIQESPPNSGRVQVSRRAPQIRGGSCGPGPPPPHPGVPIRAGEGDSAPLGCFRHGRKLPKAAKRCSGISASTRVFRLHSGISGSPRRRGRRSALPAALGGKYRRTLRVTPSRRRRHSKSVTAARRISPGRAEAARGGVSGVSGAAAEMAEGRRRPPCWEPRGAEAAAA
ncbi:unnamed protein product [Coccothraustes coccothraustes]